MPSTSNFGWTTPADTDLVKDGAAAIRTLGNNIDASLVDLKGGTTGQVLSKNSNSDLDFTWVAQDDSNAIQNALLTTTGDTIYASAASTPARLGIGTTGQVLTVSGGVPVWATPAGGGKVLQVIQGTLTTEQTTSSTTYADTTLSATITPASTNSKILVLVTHDINKFKNSGGNGDIRLVRGSTTLATMQGQGYTETEAYNHVATAFNYLDSPSTTSATTYKTQFKTNTNNVAFYVSTNNSFSSITLLEIGA